jgi:hypothetical protein
LFLVLRLEKLLWDYFIYDVLIFLVVEVEDFLKVISQVNTILTSPIMLVVSNVQEWVLDIGFRPDLGSKQDLH